MRWAGFRTSFELEEIEKLDRGRPGVFSLWQGGTHVYMDVVDDVRDALLQILENREEYWLGEYEPDGFLHAWGSVGAHRFAFDEIQHRGLREPRILPDWMKGPTP